MVQTLCGAVGRISSGRASHVFSISEYRSLCITKQWRRYVFWAPRANNYIGRLWQKSRT